MTDEPPAAEMEAQLERGGIDHVFVEFPDVNGISRSKQVSAAYFRDHWREGFPMNLAVLVQTPRNHLPDGSGIASEIDFADGVVHPDPATFRTLPWREDAGRVLCSFEYEGEPVGAAPRDALARVLDDLDVDFEFYVGSELEFYLLDADGAGGYQPATSDKHECVSWATEEVSSFYDTLWELAGAYGVPLNSLQHEHGPGQLEILFDYGEPLDQADRTFDFKRLVKQTARLADSYATFMAKPFAGESGSGYHLHVSAFRDDENVFAGDDGALSETGRHFVGGVLEHAPALTAILTPTLNGFKRYDPDGFVPYTESWGYDNRRTALRVPQGTVRVESRLGGADANPYLAIAATLAAGVHGVRERIEPSDPVAGNPADRRPELPRSPELALCALEDDETLVDLLGPALVRGYVASKRRGLRAFRETVTDWERDQYVEML